MVNRAMFFAFYKLFAEARCILVKGQFLNSNLLLKTKAVTTVFFFFFSVTLVGLVLVAMFCKNKMRHCH